jgi:hypothetical protein
VCPVGFFGSSAAIGLPLTRNVGTALARYHARNCCGKPGPPLKFPSAKQSDKRIFDEGKGLWRSGFSACGTAV